MDETTQRRIAAMGGRASHQSGRGHQFTEEEARAAGRKGGDAVSRDRAYMAAIGRRGGLAPKKARAPQSTAVVVAPSDDLATEEEE
jgi:hypothetical protein